MTNLGDAKCQHPTRNAGHVRREHLQNALAVALMLVQ